MHLVGGVRQGVVLNLDGGARWQLFFCGEPGFQGTGTGADHIASDLE
jgi:hypothetical protein